jgi:hypothetical protein
MVEVVRQSFQVSHDTPGAVSALILSPLDIS